jgi:hypothetical protein
MRDAELNNTTERIIMSKYKVPGGPQRDDAPGSRRDSRQDLPPLFAMAMMLAEALRLSRWPRDAVRALVRHAAAEPFDDPAVMQTTFLLPPESSGGARRPAVTLGRLLGQALDHQGIDPADGRCRDWVRGVVEWAIDVAPSSSAAVTLDPDGWLRYLGFKFTLVGPIEAASELLRAVRNDPGGVPAGFRAYAVPAPFGAIRTNPAAAQARDHAGFIAMVAKLDLIEHVLDDGLPEHPRPMMAGSMVPAKKGKAGARLATAGPLLRQAFLCRIPRGLWGSKEDSNITPVLPTRRARCSR